MSTSEATSSAKTEEDPESSKGAKSSETLSSKPTDPPKDSDEIFKVKKLDRNFSDIRCASGRNFTWIAAPRTFFDDIGEASDHADALTYHLKTDDEMVEEGEVPQNDPEGDGKEGRSAFKVKNRSGATVVEIRVVSESSKRRFIFPYKEPS